MGTPPLEIPMGNPGSATACNVSSCLVLGTNVFPADESVMLCMREICSVMFCVLMFCYVLCFVDDSAVL